jgi:hypothetical protein
MALNFPTTGLVSNVTTYTDDFNVSWLWNGVSWDIVPNANPVFTSVTTDSLTVNTAISSATITTTGDVTVGGQLSADSAVVTNDITTNTAHVTGGDLTASNNVNILTQPTQKQHATNKQYVDAKAVAMSIALS